MVRRVHRVLPLAPLFPFVSVDATINSDCLESKKIGKHIAIARKTHEVHFNPVGSAQPFLHQKYG